ncbi:hypothetical protein ACIBI9_62065 [Nonomuraea sp. NPDC050451]|uniref:hypothetical protein n=1 Tax=Nonomuraea sp. NPDC050451 TaxID=3364364 RepID=UPI00378E822A
MEPERYQKPTLADGWQALADGMNVHRWFLVGHKRLHGRLVERETRAAELLGRPLVINGPYRRGLLLQALHPGRSSRSLAAAVDALGAFRHRSVVASPVIDWCARSGELMLPDFAKVDPNPALPELASAEEILVLAGLGPLRSAALDVVVLYPDPVPAAVGWHADNGCGVVRWPVNAVDLAAQLAVAAAFQLLHSFYAELASDAQRAEEAANRVAAELLADAITARVLRAARAATLSGSDRNWTEACLDEAESRLLSHRIVFEGLRGVIELTMFEFVNVSVPGATQYDKYASGYGIGQS